MFIPNEYINNINANATNLHKTYKTRHNSVGKVLHWELCKKFTFDHNTKWYLHKSGICPGE